MAEKENNNEGNARDEEQLKQCFNTGCGAQFSERDNNESACVFHSGFPYFHDSYKVWNCCQKKSQDFTQFLAIQGCQKGRHSSVKKKSNEVQKSEMSKTKVEGLSTNASHVEFEFNENVIKELQLIESKNVQNSNEENLNSNKVETRIESNVEKFCRKCGKSDEKIECVYHCGQSIFHDSLKYWSCCPSKKFTDFEEFQAFKGCKNDGVDGHQMTTRDDMKRMNASAQPRLDWFQTNQNVSLVFYALKGIRSQRGTKVTTNGRHLWLKFCDSNGICVFEKEFQLKNFIFAQNSKVIIDKNKVEILLEKVEKNNYWNCLT